MSEAPIQSSYGLLLRLPPGPRLVAGIACLAVGGLLTVLLWGKGVIWGLTLFAMAAGVFLSVSGALDMQKAKKRREAWAAICSRAPEILRGMLDAKHQGKSPLRYMSAQGIHDFEFRTRLMAALDDCLKAAKPDGGNRGR